MSYIFPEIAISLLYRYIKVLLYLNYFRHAHSVGKHSCYVPYILEFTILFSFLYLSRKTHNFMALQSLLTLNTRKILFVFHHRMASTLNDIVRPVIIVQFCLTVFTISTTLVQLIYLNAETVKMTDTLLSLFYLVAVIVEFFLLCYSSNRLTSKVFYTYFST